MLIVHITGFLFYSNRCRNFFKLLIRHFLSSRGVIINNYAWITTHSVTNSIMKLISTGKSLAIPFNDRWQINSWISVMLLLLKHWQQIRYQWLCCAALLLCLLLHSEWTILLPSRVLAAGYVVLFKTWCKIGAFQKNKPRNYWKFYCR